MQEIKRLTSYTEPREGDENYDPGEEIENQRQEEKRESARLEHQEAQCYPSANLQTHQSRQSHPGFLPQRTRQSWRSQRQTRDRHSETPAPDSEDGVDHNLGQHDRQQTRDDSEDTLAPEDTATPAEVAAEGELPVYESEYARSKRAREINEPDTVEIEPSQALEQSRSKVQRQTTSESMRERKKKRHLFGLEPGARLKQHHDGAQKLWWSRIRSTLQEPFSEFLGVLVFTMIQQGGVAQATLSVGEQTAPGGNGFGPYLTVPFT